MGKKQLIWGALLVLLSGTPALFSQSADMQSGSYRNGYEQGYSSGFNKGRTDQSIGVQRDSQSSYSGQSGYAESNADRKDFEQGFRSGFELGYQDGFSGKDPQMALVPSHESGQSLSQDVIPETERTTQMPSELARADTQISTSAYTSGWDLGYKNGFNDGKSNHDSGVEFHPKKAPGYRGYRSDYQESMGKRSEFKEGYKDGFKLGYQDGYSGVMSRLVTPPQPESRAMVTQPELLPRSEQEQAQVTPQTEPESSGTGTIQDQDNTQQQSYPETTQAQNLPRSLPRTSSNVPLAGLLGLFGIASSFLIRALRAGSMKA